MPHAEEWIWGMTNHGGDAADLLVIFGITGDLARKKTFRALYRLERRDLVDCPVVGVASQEIPAENWWGRPQAILDSGEEFDDDLRPLRRPDSYVPGDVTDSACTASSPQRWPQPEAAVLPGGPPWLFGPIVEHLGPAKALARRPGRRRETVRPRPGLGAGTGARLHKVLREDQILRVDHFLGKEPVIGLEYLRFANFALAELWDRKSVACVQITMAEDFGVEGRGAFYDSVGALRDVVQNHLLQVLALVAMDPPAGGSADDMRDKKAEVFRAMPPVDPQHYVRGQYQGYADIPGVAPGSTTETYAALRLEIDNWRWADVPIFIRAGKALPDRVTEVRLLLRRTPRLSFLPRAARVDPNQIVLRIDPDPGMRLQLSALAEESWRAVHLNTSFTRELGEPRSPTSGYCTPRSSATTSSSPGRTAWRKPGASCSPFSTTRLKSAPTREDHGAR